MRLATFLCLTLTCALGCGKAGPADNAAIQTPNDQPIGSPKAIGAGPGAGYRVVSNGKADASSATETVQNLAIRK